MSDNLYKELETIVYGMGGTFFGTSDVEDHLPEPLKRYPIAITFGVRLSDAIIDEIDDKPTFTYFNHYRSVNALIDQISLRLVLSIQAHGKRHIPLLHHKAYLPHQYLTVVCFLIKQALF